MPCEWGLEVRIYGLLLNLFWRQLQKWFPMHDGSVVDQYSGSAELYTFALISALQAEIQRISTST